MRFSELTKTSRLNEANSIFELKNIIELSDSLKIKMNEPEKVFPILTDIAYFSVKALANFDPETLGRFSNDPSVNSRIKGASDALPKLKKWFWPQTYKEN